MEHVTFNLRTADGLQLYGQGWLPEGMPRAVVCLVHGLGEHSGRYSHVAAALTRAGYALLAYDLRGHGQSEGQRGHAPSWDALMDDITLLLQEAARRFPDRPLFLYGHSLGGIQVLSYALRRKPQIAGAIVTSPLLRTAFQPPAWKMWLGKTLYNLVPTFSLSNELDPRGLSHDPKVVDAYVHDPLVHNRVSARLGMDMIWTGAWALEHAAEFPLPLLLMHGAEDPICSPQASREFAARVPGDCTFKMWDGLYHETHNEPEQQQVLDVIIEWLGKHSESRS
ncbi:MAG: lysophospholipase [Chloroflexi bacterium]|nr:lysophospholipase [Chloroflexota bacterium]